MGSLTKICRNLSTYGKQFVHFPRKNMSSPGRNNDVNVRHISRDQGIISAGPHFVENQGLYDVSASDFASRLHEIIQREKLLRGSHTNQAVVEFKHPEDLKKTFRFDIKDEGDSNSELLASCEDIIKYSVKTGSPMFFNQLYHGGDPYGIAAAWLTEALNTNEHTFEVAPVFVLITHYIINRLCSLAGYSNGDGIFCPGGSMANIMGMSMARYKHNDKIKSQGMYGSKTLVMFTSEDCHYSYSKGAALLGMGADNLISVKTTDKGYMCTKNLRQKIAEQVQKGNVPIAVLATSGTTVLGAFDNLEEVADICEENKIWMHVDACWGGGVLFSNEHRSLMKGIERSDSLCISLHKMMGAPLQCVPLLTKEKGILQKNFGFGATYLFQQDKFYDVSYDLGDKTVQCGRKADAMKFWLMWKARGNAGMSKHVDYIFNLADYFKKKLEKTPGFRVVMPECTNIGFWYIPPSMQGKEENEEWWKQLHLVAPKIKESMQLSGSMLIGYQPLKSKGFVNFFRIIIESPRLTEKDLDHVIEEIDKLGQKL